MITYTTFPSPFGRLGIARTQKGLCRLSFPEKTPQLPTYLRTQFPGETILKDNHGLQSAIDQLKAYFAGERKTFDLVLDLRLPPFYKKVLEEVRKIPYGTTASYKDIAQRLKNPLAVRAVGSANARNPLPIIIPCHRVVGHNGGLGGYGGRLDRKVILLELEGAPLPWHGKPNFNKPRMKTFN
ncbi:MAG: methylated-DNA--[protein]-cysteine S-methyltransferase [Fidelibacterota bacterium]